MVECPPPHMVLHEPLDDKSTRIFWREYVSQYSEEVEPSELDAAETCSVEEFSKQFEIWVTSKSSKRIKLLMVWHAHFLSLACQQMLRRSLEQRSFRCRVWFHVEEPTLQAAIVSRCIVKTLPNVVHVPTIVGPPLDTSLWDNPRIYETELESPKE